MYLKYREICRHVYTYMEGKLGMLSRILHTIRSLMHSYPANKAIAQVKNSAGLMDSSFRC